MPRFSRAAMRSKRLGRSLIRLKKRGTARMHRNSFSIRPVRGDRKRLKISWPGMTGAGGAFRSSMAAPTQTYSPGLPVEVRDIDRELKKLWQQNEGATRASLVNLAVYSEDPDSLERNTRLVSELTENLACRAIVIAADPNPKQDHVEAWISAHCHVSRAGSKQICSEQISFRLQGPCTSLLANIVFAHLDSDLPLYLWWEGELRDPIDSQLWSWVDRLIYDSHDWKDVAQQLAL